VGAIDPANLGKAQMPAVALEDYIDGTVNPVANEKFGGAKPLLVFEVI
jgi:hypothetical protein